MRPHKEFNLWDAHVKEDEPARNKHESGSIQLFVYTYLG